MQCHLLQKTSDFINSNEKKIHDELTRHSAVRMDPPILTADDKITRHKTFKANIPCNGT